MFHLKRQLFFLALLLTCGRACATTPFELFKNYDFSSGGYALVGISSESDPNDLVDSLGDFYTRDTAVLNEFKRTWTFTTESPEYACGYHYAIHLTHHGIEEMAFYINLNCHQLRTKNGSYFFSTRLLRHLAGRLKTRVYYCSSSFPSLVTGRLSVDSIQKQDTSLLWIPQPRWLKYDGTFELLLVDSANRFAHDSTSVWGEGLLTAFFQQQFPGEVFELEVFSAYGPPGEPGEYGIRFFAKKSLHDQLRGRYKPTRGWEPLQAQIGYWRRNRCETRH